MPFIKLLIVNRLKNLQKNYSSCYLYTDDEWLLVLKLFDVLFKYIDLSDDKLIRTNLKNDIENGGNYIYKINFSKYIMD